MESKTLQKKLESKLRRLIKKYNLNVKSPYSDSYYNTEVDWGYKPEGSLRLSDHWNFESCDSIHCELANTDKYTERWLLCEYHEGKYHIVEELFTPEEEEMEKRCRRRALNKRIKAFEAEKKRKEKIEMLLKKGSNLKVKYKQVYGVGRYQSSKQIIEVCYCKGNYAYTSHGKRKVFEVIL